MSISESLGDIESAPPVYDILTTCLSLDEEDRFVPLLNSGGVVSWVYTSKINSIGLLSLSYVSNFGLE